MLWAPFLGFVAALLTTAVADNAVIQDPDTGLVFTSNFQLYKSDGRGITYRVAVPDDAQNYAAFDVVVQVIVPNDVGWAGLAWGGSMTNNPLLVAWRGSSNNVILSPPLGKVSQAFTPAPNPPSPPAAFSPRTSPTTKTLTPALPPSSHVMPTPSTTSTYTLFKAGTKSNSTHWQFTALCKGCTSWDSGTSSATRYLSPRGGNRLAFAYSPTKPSSANSPSSSLPIHDVHGYWNQDFAAAANANFAATVQRLASS